MADLYTWIGGLEGKDCTFNKIEYIRIINRNEGSIDIIFDMKNTKSKLLRLLLVDKDRKYLQEKLTDLAKAIGNDENIDFKESGKNKRLLKEGDIIEIKQGDTIRTEVPKHFLYSGKKGNFTLAKETITICGELSYLAGEYMVTDAFKENGAMFDKNGWHVFCVKKYDNRQIKIDFYQTGATETVIKDIKPVGRTTLQYL